MALDNIWSVLLLNYTSLSLSEICTSSICVYKYICSIHGKFSYEVWSVLLQKRAQRSPERQRIPQECLSFKIVLSRSLDSLDVSLLRLFSRKESIESFVLGVYRIQYQLQSTYFSETFLYWQLRFSFKRCNRPWNHLVPLPWWHRLLKIFNAFFFLISHQ